MGRKRFIIQIDKEKCTGCRACEKKCSKVTRPALCSGCGKCLGVCPSNAISLIERTNNNKTRKKMKTKAKGFGHMIMVLAAIAGFGAIVMLLWNALLPDIFGFISLNFWQATGLLVLCRILFGDISTSAVRHAHHHHHSQLHKKWRDMTPEQRKKFIDKRRQFGFGGHFGKEFFDMNEHEEAEKGND